MPFSLLSILPSFGLIVRLQKQKQRIGRVEEEGREDKKKEKRKGERQEGEYKGRRSWERQRERR